ncbi:MAG: transcriptional repressor LexA [Bacilli bacterium]|nr:transcriptional repressor LexA [Bacilli bacterium]
MKNENLSHKQNEILIFIKKFMAENKFSPSVRDICKGVNLNSPATVHVHLTNLINKGFIKRNPKNNRLIELMVPNEFETNVDSVINVPLLGKVTAGNPIEAIENPDEYFSLPSEMVPTGKNIFTLRVNGESMINAGIYDNDIVIVESVNTANNGDIVVAMNEDNEVTLKRFYKEKNYFRLQPENDLMLPIILNNVTILGKAIGLYRKL